MILAFDLDDTLYDERTFVYSGFRAVANMLEPLVGIGTQVLQDRMRHLLDEHGRGRVFDDLLGELDRGSVDLVGECVTVYRSHSPTIAPFPGVDSMLASLAGRSLYLVTDGDPEVQARKIDALGIAASFAEIFRTWALGRSSAKPSLACFDIIREREACEWSDLVYIADDPSKDFVSLRAVGARTVRVHSGRFAATVAAPGFDAEFHVDRVTDAPGLLGIAPLGSD